MRVESRGRTRGRDLVAEVNDGRGARDHAPVRADQRLARAEAEVAAAVHPRGRDRGERRDERERALLERDGHAADAGAVDVAGDGDALAPAREGVGDARR